MNKKWPRRGANSFPSDVITKKLIEFLENFTLYIFHKGRKSVFRYTFLGKVTGFELPVHKGSTWLCSLAFRMRRVTSFSRVS